VETISRSNLALLSRLRNSLQYILQSLVRTDRHAIRQDRRLFETKYSARPRNSRTRPAGLWHHFIAQADPYEDEKPHFKGTILDAFNRAKFCDVVGLAKELDREKDSELALTPKRNIDDAFVMLLLLCC
jgi:hypothetical protein